MKWSFSLSTKNKQVAVLTTFVKNILNKYKIDRLKFDNAGEIVAALKAFKEEGFRITVECTVWKTPQQNRIIEHEFAILYERICALNNPAEFEKEKR